MLEEYIKKMTLSLEIGLALRGVTGIAYLLTEKETRRLRLHLESQTKSPQVSQSHHPTHRQRQQQQYYLLTIICTCSPHSILEPCRTRPAHLMQQPPKVCSSNLAKLQVQTLKINTLINLTTKPALLFVLTMPYTAVLVSLEHVVTTRL